MIQKILSLEERKRQLENDTRKLIHDLNVYHEINSIFQRAIDNIWKDAEEELDHYNENVCDRDEEIVVTRIVRQR